MCWWRSAALVRCTPHDLLRLVPGAEREIGDVYRQLEARIIADVKRLRTMGEPAIARFASMRYAGQGHEIRVDLPAFPVRSDFVYELSARFEAAYLKKYGYCQGGAVVEAVDWYVVASLANAQAGSHRATSWKKPACGSFRRGTRAAYFPEIGGYADCAVVDRDALPVGEVVEGPAIIEEAEATTLLLPRCSAAASPRGHLVMTIGEG